MKKKDKYTINDLLELIEYLRSDKGCPWDREQNHESIKHNLIEEAYEVVDAINDNDSGAMADELGDLLLQIVFHTQMAKEKNQFDFDDVLKHVCDKLISRHTHVFGEDKEGNSGKYDSAQEVIKLWDKNKKKEKKQKTHTQSMKEISRAYPALIKAYKIQKKASSAGFDWDNIDDVVEKIYEETEEVKKASLDIGENSQREVEMEIGDLLFSVVNYARFLGVDPEVALDMSNKKFIGRFEMVEKEITDSGREMTGIPLEELDIVWEKTKKGKEMK